MTNSQQPYVVLAAVQFDDTGELALREACRIAAQHTSTELHLVHAAVPSFASEHEGESTAIVAQLARAPHKLREYVDRICAGTNLKLIAHIRSGSAHEIILEVAADLTADVIVLGTHQRSGLGKLVLGSVAERVLREAHCPVLIALPKSYAAQSPSIDPPCPDCSSVRAAAKDPDAWCERHSRTRLRPHVYTPSDHPRPSQLGT
jgi:nucleotide-binding universal stress UspA family protein